MTIYFIAVSGRIKVGYSKNATRRIKDLSTHHADPIEVLGTIEGDVPLEKAIHAAFREHHHRYEWFKDSAPLRDKIRIILDKGPQALDIGPIAPKEKRPFIASSVAPDAFAKVCAVIWGDDAAEELAGLGEVSVETARGWLSDPSSIPRLVRMAFSVPLFNSCYGFPQESYKRAPHQTEQKRSAS